jgi:hypothetical protein
MIALNVALALERLTRQADYVMSRGDMGLGLSRSAYLADLALVTQSLDATTAPERPLSPPETSERCWLIERSIDGVPHWLAWRGLDAMTWTPIAGEADRYAWAIAAGRDARLIVRAHGIECIATEHMFVGSAAAARRREMSRALEQWELRCSDAIDLTGPELDDLLATVRALVDAAVRRDRERCAWPSAGRVVKRDAGAR